MPVFEQFAINLADSDTLNDFCRVRANTAISFVQLSTGAAIWSARSLDLGDLRVLQVSGTGRHLWIDNRLSREWRFATMIEATGGPEIGRQEIFAHTAHLLRPGQSAGLCRGEKC